MIEKLRGDHVLEYEVVDLRTAGFSSRLSFRIRGIKTPAVSDGERVFQDVPTEEILTEPSRNLPKDN